MHLLTWVGFSLIGYVPNTLYKWYVLYGDQNPIPP
jgi:hypothetical protein